MDIWHCAIVRQPAAAIVENGIDPEAVVWFPEMPARSYRADPFGLWRDGKLHVFTEAFDYRSRIGHIDLLIFNAACGLLEARTVLKEAWHLSYPVVFEAEGEVWLLPEARASGTLTLYRARQFPDVWEAACQIPLDGPAIDATPFFHDRRWWLFYAPATDKAARRRHLHVAFADCLTGPWRLHPRNPVRVDLGSARPGGTARQAVGAIILPVQDCRQSYGGAIRELAISRLDETGFEATDRPGLTPPFWMAPFTAGLHTLSAAGPVTLIDVKRIDTSLHAHAVRIGGILRSKRFWNG